MRRSGFMKLLAASSLSGLLFLGASCATPDSAPETRLGFFITSAGSGDGANLGGLAGADRICQARAEAVGAGSRRWRPYLSASARPGSPAVNARDRIGPGPWYNAKGVPVAMSVADLHSGSNQLNKQNSLTEAG